MPATPARSHDTPRPPSVAGPRVGAFAALEGAPDAPGWRWSDGMFEIHGFAPGQVRPSLELWLTHVAVEHRALVRALLTSDGAATSAPYRLRDARGRDRWCMLVLTSGEARPEGYLVDMTEEWRRAAAEVANAAIVDAAARTAIVDQAVGMIIAARGVGAPDASQQLEACARAIGRAVDEIATAIVDGVVAGEPAAAVLARVGVPGPQRR